MPARWRRGQSRTYASPSSEPASTYLPSGEIQARTRAERQTKPAYFWIEYGRRLLDLNMWQKFCGGGEEEQKVVRGEAWLDSRDCLPHDIPLVPSPALGHCGDHMTVT